MDKIKTRIAILDGFRAIAILAVLLFHYFSRWTPPLNRLSVYPYKSKYDYFSLGHLGVQFFFIISGFVIFFTLDNTDNFILFWKKRFIRLFPSMLIASICTYLVFRFFDKVNLFPDSHNPWNILTSITFINPFILSKIFTSSNFGSISGSYWSLWPEVQFYFLASILFYFDKKKFVNHFIIISFGLIISNYILQNIEGSNVLKISLSPRVINSYDVWFRQAFNLVLYLPYFTMGMFFYLLFKNKSKNIKTSQIIKFCMGVLILYIIYSGVQMPVRLWYLGMIMSFFGFIYFPKKLSLLEHKSITTIGKSSYFLYLIHENLGVLFIFSLGGHFLQLSFIFTILVILAFIEMSKLFTNHVDQPLQFILANNKYIGTCK